jgi:hypothetical protein
MWPGQRRKERGDLAGKHITRRSGGKGARRRQGRGRSGGSGRSAHTHEAGENKGVQSHGPVSLGLARRTMPLFIYLNYFKKT